MEHEKDFYTSGFRPGIGDCVVLFGDWLCRRDQRNWPHRGLFLLHRRGTSGLGPIDSCRNPPFRFHWDGVHVIPKGRDAYPGDVRGKVDFTSEDFFPGGGDINLVWFMEAMGDGKRRDA